jgi:hypothetical protein
MYQLINADIEHRAYPRTYSIPRRIVRESLRPGDFVKLVFKVDPPVPRASAERMWVEVTHLSYGRYRSNLANDPDYIPELHHGDLIEFGPEHVAARQPRADDPFLSDPNAFAIVSRAVWDQDAWPARLERTDFPDPTFSGWIIFAGSESPEFKADMNNFVPVAEPTLFDRFRVLDSGLEGPVGTTMIWSEEDAEYRVDVT